MVSMTVNNFIKALGSKVKKITYDTTQTEGVVLSDDGLTANVYNVSLSGEFDFSNRFPSSLVSADLRGLNTSNISSFGSTFGECFNLKNLDVSNWNTSKADFFGSTFGNCFNLKNLDLSNWNTSKATNFNNMFGNCYNLENLDLSNFNVSDDALTSNMFSGMNGTQIKISNKWNKKEDEYENESLGTNLKYIKNGVALW